MVSSFSDLKPGSTFSTDTKLRSSSPPHTVSVIASATSATISAARVRRRAGDAVARVPSRNVSCACDVAADAAPGRMPTIKPVTTESVRAKRTTGNAG